LCADIPSLRQPTVHNVRILTLHNHLRVGAAQLQTVSRFDPLTVQAGDGTDGAENRLRIVCTPSLTSWVSVRAECAGRPEKGSLDKRSGELATMIEASAVAAIPPASRAARSSPRRSTTTIRNPRAGCDGTIVSVMRENASALRRRGNCVVSLTAGSVPGGIRRTGFWKSAGHPARQHELVGRETAGGPPMIGSLDTRPLSVSLSCGTSAHRARLAAPGTRT
jgi:hypothetical protein